VVTGNGTDRAALLDGFTITGGNANGDPVLLQDLGGGIYTFQGRPRLCHLVVTKSSAAFGGGAIANDQGSLEMCHSTIVGNLAGDSGGGILARQNDTVVLHRVSIVGNQAQIGGGVVPIAQLTVIILGFFAGNHANLDGGGLAVSGNTILTQSVFSGNTANSYGAAIASSNIDPVLTQVTLTNNVSFGNGGAFGLQDSDPIIYNSIFWGNVGGEIVARTSGSQANIHYSLVQGGYSAGTHIINANPQFVDADGADNLAGTLDDNVRIGAGSPVIDVGDNGYIPADLTDEDGDGDANETAPFDLGGQPRRRGAAVDLGAYERNTAPLTTSYLPLILREST